MNYEIMVSRGRCGESYMGLQHRCTVLLDGEGSEVFDVEQAVAQGCISKDGSPYYIGIGMVPSIIDVWGYDREFCSSSSSSSSPSPSSSSSSTNVTQKLK